MINQEQAKQLILSNAKRNELESQSIVRNQPSHRQIPDHIKQVASYVFKSLTTTRPGWRNGFTNKGQTDERLVTNYKIALLQAMQENKIDTIEKVEAGLNTLRNQPGAFLPSIGDFISACKPQASGELNCAMYQEYRPERLIAQGTFQERQAMAKSELAKIKQMLGK